MTLIRHIARPALVSSVFAIVLQLPAGTEVLTQTPTGPQQAPRAEAVAAYGRLPLSFEANQGQSADAHVKFLSGGTGYSLRLTPTEAVLILTQPALEARDQTNSNSTAVVGMRFVGANANPEIVGRDELPGKSNYFIGSDPSQWLTDVPNYAKVEYREVYPGVGLIYYGNQRQLEYDFVMSPGSDPSVIRLAFDGVDQLHVDDQGHLVLRVGSGEVRQKKPFIYQDVDGVRQPIAGGYSVEGQQVAFEVGDYDLGRPLIIDPVLTYSTYLGGDRREWGYGIAIEPGCLANCSAYVVETRDADPAQTNFDVFVTKFNAAGTSIVYSTRIGGASHDFGRDIAVDKHGNAYITGMTESSTLPVFPPPGSPVDPPFQTTLIGPSDAFVVKLNSTGSALVYVTYLGGSGTENGLPFLGALAVDAGGNAYITGSTTSADFPTSEDAFDRTCNVASTPCSASLRDAFVSKLSADGSALDFSTFLGGRFMDVGLDIAVDSSNRSYVVGSTRSSTDDPGTAENEAFPTTPTAFQPVFGGSIDGFVTQLNADGSDVIYSTYFGWTGTDNSFSFGAAIALDTVDNVYITGTTASTNLPTRMAFQNSFGGGWAGDAFVAKLNPIADGDLSLVFSTYLGGSSDDYGLGIAVDPLGRAYVTGTTSSTNLPIQDAVQSTYGGGAFGDVFVTRLDVTGLTLGYSTYLGGTDSDYSRGITVDASGAAYITGSTRSMDDPGTVKNEGFPTINPLQSNNGSFPSLTTKDTFIAKLGQNHPPVANSGPPQTVECVSSEGTLVTLDGLGSTDPDGDPLTYVWTDETGTVVGTTVTLDVTPPLGVSTFTLVVSDGFAKSDPATVAITIVDTTAPMLTVSVSPAVINANNHKLVEITATIDVGDDCDAAPVVELISVESNQPEDGTGDGDTPDDIQTGPDPHTFFVRAERAGTGGGRVYTATYRATDASGNTAEAYAEVTVPHDNSGS